jgi:hypothetical protein
LRVSRDNWLRFVFRASYELFNIIPGVPETVSFKANLVRIGFDYKFWWSEPPKPLVAKN